MTFAAPEAPVRPSLGRSVRIPERELPRTNRRPLLAAASLLLVLVAMGTFAVLYSHAKSTTPVLVATRAIPPGAVITPNDLSVVNVGGVGFRGIGAAYERQVLGQVAAAMIPPGALLAPGDVASGSPSGGMRVVGVALHVGQTPANGLDIGQYVDVVYAPTTVTSSAPAAPGSSGSTNSPLVPGADIVSSVEVVDVVDPALNAAGNSTGASTIVSLLVPTNSAGQVAQAAATGSISLVLSGPGGTGTPASS
jgi:Flp pilus assembly protein CpaB